MEYSKLSSKLEKAGEAREAINGIKNCEKIEITTGSGKVIILENEMKDKVDGYMIEGLENYIGEIEKGMREKLNEKNR